MNTFDDDNDATFFDEPRRRPPRDRTRRPQRSSPRRAGPSAGANGVLRLAGLVALGIALVFGFVLWIGSCSGQSKRDTYASYIDAMKPLAQDSASVGAKFAKALGTRALTANSFESDLTSWARQEQRDYVAAQRLQPPGPLQSAHAQALTAFQLRLSGLVGIGNQLALAQSKHYSASAAAAALASEAQLLTASDVLWEQLYKLAATQVLATQNVPGVIVPASKIVKTPDIVSPHSLAILYQRVGTPSSDGRVTGLHGTDLVYTNAVESGVPKRLYTTSATTVSASTSSLAIDVVFENSGNYPEVQIPVTLTVKASGESVFTHTETVAQLAAHTQTTVTFTHLQLPPKAFGHNDFISVKVGSVAGEKQLADNEATYPVFFLVSRN